MPITLYPTTLKYKTQDGTFQSATAIKGDSGEAIVEQVSGTNPIIVCEDNHRYICGEVLSLNITPSVNGVSEIIFTSGSSAAVLTVPSTIKWPEWFNPNALETNATYQLKITNNLANVAMWPEEGLTGDTRTRIQKMLGIYEAPWELIRGDTVTNATKANIDITVDNNGQPFELTDLRLMITFPSQETEVKVESYGRVKCYYGTNNYDTLYIGAMTQAAGSSARGARVWIEQHNGMIERYYTTNSSTGNNVSVLTNNAITPGDTSHWRLANTMISYTKVSIEEVTGTCKYYLFGKRKWQ